MADEKSDHQLLLEILKEMAVLNERVSHHLTNTCARHEAQMARHEERIEWLKSKIWMAVGGLTIVQASITLAVAFFKK